MGLCLLDPRSAGGVGPGEGQEGVFVFQGTSAEGPQREELGPFSEQVRILTSPNPLIPQPLCHFVGTWSSQPGEVGAWGSSITHPSYVTLGRLQASLGCRSGVRASLLDSPTMSKNRYLPVSTSCLYSAPGLTLHWRWGRWRCLMVQPQAPEAHQPGSNPSSPTSCLCDPQQVA